jgi:hypothetical protein
MICAIEYVRLVNLVIVTPPSSLLLHRNVKGQIAHDTNHTV